MDGAQLAGFLDPSLRGRASGAIVVVREADGREGDRPYATLAIREGTVSVNASDASTRRMGEFTPRGAMRFVLDVEEVSTDHILFETRFRTRPNLRVEYDCEILRPEAQPSPR